MFAERTIRRLTNARRRRQGFQYLGSFTGKSLMEINAKARELRNADPTLYIQCLVYRETAKGFRSCTFWAKPLNQVLADGITCTAWSN